MKRLLIIAIVAFSLYSCGDAGVGFNVKKELPVDADFAIPGPPLGTPVLGYDPPGNEQSTTFELSEVSSNVDDLGELSLNSMSYQIANVSDNVNLDEISIKVMLGGSEVTLVNLTGPLENTDKVMVSLTPTQLAQLEDQLFQQKELDAIINVDLDEVPDEEGVDLTFRTFYDVTLKIRQ